MFPRTGRGFVPSVPVLWVLVLGAVLMGARWDLLVLIGISLIDTDVDRLFSLSLSFFKVNS